MRQCVLYVAHPIRKSCPSCMYAMRSKNTRMKNCMHARSNKSITSADPGKAKGLLDDGIKFWETGFHEHLCFHDPAFPSLGFLLQIIGSTSQESFPLIVTCLSWKASWFNVVREHRTCSPSTILPCMSIMPSKCAGLEFFG